ncbi:MAG: hypothetical protein ACI4MS_01705 [Candidatus Coproplasma sp.]
MNEYQPKKVCDNCKAFNVCRKSAKGKDACKKYIACLPIPPVKIYSPSKKANGTKKIVVIKVKSIFADRDINNIRKQFIEQAKTGLVVADSCTEIYNIEVADEITETEIEVEFIR